MQTVQIIFNMFRQQPGRASSSPRPRRRQVGILARVPLASGMLTGKMTPTSHVRAGRPPQLQPPRRGVRQGRDVLGRGLRGGLEAVEELRPLVPAGATMAQLALRWILMFDGGDVRHPGREDARAGRGQRRRRRPAAALLRPRWRR